jgi:homoserine kinase type II
MSVYTEVGRDDLIAFLAQYAVGELVSFEGISEGIENTNYFVDTTEGRFVLTLFEQHEFDELSYFLDVMTFYYQQGIPSAHPAADKNGDYLKTLCGRPAALVMRLQGRGVNELATIKQCEQIGSVVAEMHLAGQQFTGKRENGRGNAWRQQTGQRLVSMLSDEQAAVLQDELNYQQGYESLGLPVGVSHSDLFRDNALFDGDELKGIIDFYYACDEYLTYDLAVTVNDWCVDEDGLLSQERCQALMKAYMEKRPFSELEQTHWNRMLRAGALRFWLSRLQDKLFPKEGELTHIKNPDAFLKILQQHRDSEIELFEAIA